MKRISIAVLILCACFAPLAWGQQPASTCSNKWAQFHKYNMGRHNPCEKVLNVKNVKNLTLKWSTAPAGGFSSPAVANGVVYSATYALDASTGDLLWSYTAAGNYVSSSPAVANGVVYVGSNDGNVYALNVTTGALLWSYQTGNVVFSSPAVTNGVVYVGSGDGNVYAFGLK